MLSEDPRLALLLLDPRLTRPNSDRFGAFGRCVAGSMAVPAALRARSEQGRGGEIPATSKATPLILNHVMMTD